jgi:hypothetical protein
MYFRLGGGTLKGISKPGHIVWSRVFVEGGKLKVRHRPGQVVELPPRKPSDRWQQTTPQWPIMHAVLDGVSRDQMMARHKSNHIQVVYAPDARAREKRPSTPRPPPCTRSGLEVSLCGNARGRARLPRRGSGEAR